MYQGELLVINTPGGVKAEIGGTILELRMENHQKGIKILEVIESLRSVVLSGDKIHVLVDDPLNGEIVVRNALQAQDMEILGLTVVRPSLEDVFVSMVRQKKRS